LFLAGNRVGQVGQPGGGVWYLPPAGGDAVERALDRYAAAAQAYQRG
jgi:hypothetical protein